jgi:large subunit ribosomal protein L32e
LKKEGSDGMAETARAKTKETQKEKTTAREEKKPPIAAEKKENVSQKKEIKAKKFIQWVKKENKAKSKEARETQAKLSRRKKVPVMRGRFGKKNIRRKSIEKWDKWRKPHGIDLDKGIEHGSRPKIGYRSESSIRGIHPSGYKEILVCNENDLAGVDSKTTAARFSSVLGKKKRNELMKKANEKGIWVLN